jgi:UDP-N-acetylglucosamine--N-acetylmuramyl-(pentapeptide) pyrophosphoryl-undecaprenol N-acetylglucosamine transferase
MKQMKKQMQQWQKIKVIISGGGTGGHIFPAIAIANAIKKMSPQSKILFIGAKGRMEMEKVPQAGYEIIGLPIQGIQRKLSAKNLLLPFRLLSSLLQSRKILKSFKPDVAIGVGGYASGPLLYISTGMKIPSLIQEQNSYAGVTNKLLAKRVNKICVAYDGMEKFFPKNKIFVTGNPVRREVVTNTVSRDEALNFFGLKKEKKTILVVGGSLGAGTINESIRNNLKEFAEHDIQLVWQTGKFYYQTLKDATVNYSDLVKVFDFINRMDMAYSAADVVISRAGAIAISELCCLKKAVILVPSPNVAEDHQTKNAMALVNKNAAIMVKDSEAKEKLVSEVLQLVADESLQKQLSGNIEKLAHLNADEQIAETIFKLAEKK